MSMNQGFFMKMSRVLFLLLSTPMLVAPAFAEKAYVTDSFRISLRRGPSIENKILRFIPSAQPVEVLETTDGWSRVRTIEPEETQITGWVLSRYLLQRLPYQNQVERLQQKETELETLKTELSKSLEETTAERDRLQASVKTLASERDNIHGNFSKLKEDAADFLELKARFQSQSERLAHLESENVLLANENRQKWMGLGGGLVLSGFFLGFLFGRRERRRGAPRLR